MNCRNCFRNNGSALLGIAILATAPAASAEEVRSRTLFDSGMGTARDLIVVLNPQNAPAPGSEVSVYLPVRFAFDSDRLSDAARRNLAVISEAMLAPEFGDVIFTVEGHTDASGSAAYNEGLSLRRARSAADYLVRLGVPRSRLAVRGLGETAPLPGADPLAAEQRRVEFVRRF